MTADFDHRSAARAVVRRVKDDLEELAAISAPGPGTSRLAYGPEDAEARHWFKDRCDRYGLSFQADEVGNCFASMPGSQSARSLLMGSHLDSVPGGGRYDGTVGVVFGLEMARFFYERDRSLPLVVASFACEESTRFGFGTLGSRFLIGDLSMDSFSIVTDRYGQTLDAVLANSGIDELKPSPITFPDTFGSYLEVHIDQGTLLTSVGARIGIVSTIAGVHRTEFRWLGETAHSGARWRDDRRDALLAASSFIVGLNKWWRAVDPKGTRLQLTVGSFSVHPNSPNTVPGEVTMIVDLRSTEATVMDQSFAHLRQQAESVGSGHGVTVEIRDLGRSEPRVMDNEVIGVLEASAGRVGVEAPSCISLAGHDALVIGRRLQTGMLLLANPTGISHAPTESVDDDALFECALVVLEALPALAEAL